MIKDDLTYAVIGCAMNVHNFLGCGFQELIYQRCLAIELSNAGLLFERESDQEIIYRDDFVGSRRVDFIVEGKLLVELKAITQLEKVNFIQVKNYLEVYDYDIGLLLNFGALKLEYKRIYKRCQ